MINEPSFPDLLSILERTNDINIVVVGDLMLDKFVYGDVERISPESPVPVLAIEREDTMLGGAGNALANLAELDVNATLIGLIGNDQQGTEIKDIIGTLNAKRIKHDVVVDDTRPTILKTRYLAGHQQLLRSDAEDKNEITQDTYEKILKSYKKHVAKADIAILSDYGKGLLTRKIAKRMIEIASKYNVRVIIDPKGADFSKYAGAFAVTPNKKELAEASNMPVDTDEQVEAAGAHIIETCDIETVFATRGSDGISIIQKGEVPVHIPTVNVEVYDVSGAGDTVIATIAAALAGGASVTEAVQLANIAGGIVVSKVGTAPIRREEILNELSAAREPVQTPDDALETVKRWRAKGYKVGFTNGCFDILHKGHVTYLQEARAHCDRLIVGLNRDSSIKILKGKDRPVHDEDGRGVVLAALGCVDVVVLFGAKKKGDDNTASALLNHLQPDFYFKGGDYEVDDIPETPTVRAYGGEVKVLSEVKGYSTTNAINKMQGKAA